MMRTVALTCGWRRHNLKRKLANLAPISQAEFDERVQAYVGDTSEKGKKKEHLGEKARAKAQVKAEQRAAKENARKQAGTAAAEVPSLPFPPFSLPTRYKYNK